MSPKKVVGALLVAVALSACVASQSSQTTSPERFSQRFVTVHCSSPREAVTDLCEAKAQRACDDGEVRLKNILSREEVRGPVEVHGRSGALVYHYSVEYYCVD